MRKQGKKQRRRKKKKREKKACDTEMRRRQSSYGREAMRPGTRREKQRRQRDRTINANKKLFYLGVCIFGEF